MSVHPGRAAMAGSEPAVAHVMREYLPRSQTFVYTLLRFQREFRPVVFAGETSNLTEFPLDSVVRMGTGALPRRRGAAGRLFARTRAATGTSKVPPSLKPAVRWARRRVMSPIERPGFDPVLKAEYEARLLREVHAAGCVLVHAHFAPTACRHLDIRRKAGIPLVTTFYGFDLGLVRADARWREPYARLFDEGDAFLCEGPRMAGHLVSLGCPPDKVRIAKIGLDLSRFPFRPRRRTGGLVLLQTGRFVEKKGFDLSIRALAAAERRLASAQLWLVGDGPKRAALEDLATRLGVASRVRFLGSLSHDDYRRTIDRAHIGLQPSRVASNGDTEGGAPTVLLEMQAAGMPVVGTRHADIPAVVAEPDGLVDEEDYAGLADAIVRAAELSERDWRARCERGRRLVETEHDAARTAAPVERLYAELTGLTMPREREAAARRARAPA